MLTLPSECHFWTMKEAEVHIKNTDYGAYRYVRSREIQQMPAIEQLAFEAKRDYHEQRQGLMVLKNNNRKGSQGRLKDNLKKLEELLKNYRVVHVHWTDAAQVLLLFANGMIAHICIDVFTGDILRMVYEKYLLGKMAADTITDAFFTRTHIVLAYNTNQVTVVHLQKPNTRPQGPEKVANMDPKIFHALIPGTPERKLPRHLNVNSSGEMFVIWTKSSQNEVFPWRPTIRDQDRANIHVFKLKGVQLDFLSYCWSENDPLYVDFLRSVDNQIITLEQKINRKGDVLAEICSYDITVGKMTRGSLSMVPVSTQITCFAFSPDQEKLFLGCLDRNICLHDLILQTTKSAIPIDIVPTRCSWHCDSSLILVANNRSQFQCYDLALTPIGQQLLGEDVRPLQLLDLSHYFTSFSTSAALVAPSLISSSSLIASTSSASTAAGATMTASLNNLNSTTATANLCQISFSRKPELSQYVQHKYAPTDCFLLLLYEHGPLGCLRFPAAAGMRGDIHNSGLTADVLLDQYLHLHQLDKAINLLGALNWETYGAMCLISLHKIANYVFYHSDPQQHCTGVELMSRALQTFTDSLSEETKDEFSDQVFDLKRRFFFYLLRYESFTEAFEVAQDIEDYDLFMDLFNVTKSERHLVEFSTAAFSQAAAILHEEDRDNGNLSIAVDCQSESICSASTISDENSKIEPTDQQSRHQQPQQCNNYNCSSSNNNNHHHRQQQLQQQHQKHQKFPKNYVPALPSYKSKVLSAEMIKINIPKPELKVNSLTTSNNSAPQHQQQQVVHSKGVTTASTTNNVYHLPTLSSSTSITNTTKKKQPQKSSTSTKTVLQILPATSSNHSTNASSWKSGGKRNPTSINVVPGVQRDVLDNGVSVTHVYPTDPAAANGTGIHSTNSIHRSHSNALNSNTLPTNYLHLPTPIIVAEHKPPTVAIPPSLAASSMGGQMVQRGYHQPPQQMTTTIPLPAATYQPKFFQHPLVSGNIPPTSNNTNGNVYNGALSLAAHSTSNEEYQKSLLSKKPTASILSNGGGSSLQNGHHHYHTSHHFQAQQQQSQSQQQHQREILTQPMNHAYHNAMVNPAGNMKDGSGKSGTGEKNKVKFSDTVQVAVVPVGIYSNQEIPRKEKFPHVMIMKRNGYARPLAMTTLTNPKKELADSLPLCHPNDEYLKDFNPLTTTITTTSTAAVASSAGIIPSANTNGGLF